MRKVPFLITLLLLLALLQLYEFAAERKFPKYSVLKSAWFERALEWKESFQKSHVSSTDSNGRAEKDKNAKEEPIQNKIGLPDGPVTKQKTKPKKKPTPHSVNQRVMREMAGYSTNSLLSLWTPEQLSGDPGDERIRKISTPDLSPPPQLEPRLGLPPLPANRLQSIRRVHVAHGDKPVALTFDLCEQADDRTGYDRGVVNTLRSEAIRATFFAGGKWMKNHVEKTQQLMADPNFEIGNHGWTHGNLRVMKGQSMRDQVVWTQAQYEHIYKIIEDRAEKHGLSEQFRQVSPVMKTLRFPYGTCSGESLDAVNQLGLAAIQWDVVSGDAAKGQSPNAMAKKVISQVQPGSIVVFHANGRGNGTSEALPQIIAGLRKKGYQFVTVSDLLEFGEPETSDVCYELKPGDNNKYDAIFGDGTGAN